MKRLLTATIIALGCAVFVPHLWASEASVNGRHAAQSLTKLLGTPDEALEKLDANHDGTVNKDEFMKGLSDLSNGRLTPTFSGTIFDRADRDTNSALTQKELRGLMVEPDQSVANVRGVILGETKPAEVEPAENKPAKNTTQGSASRGSAVARLLGPLDAAHKKMDTNADDKVSKDEFIKYASNVSNGRLNSKVGESIFAKYDEDHDGSLTLEELLKLQTSGNPAPNANESTTSRDAAGRSPAVVQEEIPLESRRWKSGDQSALPPAKLDQLLDAALAAENLTAAMPLSDEQFLRRVTLDLAGRPPTAADVQSFLSSTDQAKRPLAIERLLATDDFAHHWAHFWRDVMQSKASSTQVIYELHRGAALEEWLAARLRANRSWAEITRGLITADGVITVPSDPKNGNAGFLLCHTGDDAEVGRAVDTTRVFLGIQLECAQCHDHPTDIWKRQQFHEFAAYYGRLREDKMTPDGKRGLQLASKVRGEYEMPDRYDASKTTVTHPRFFLTDEALREDSDDRTRREALAEQVVASEWFAKAFVNRTWSQLMGRGFVEPADNLGPSQKPIYPDLFDALAKSFRASDFNVKELIATITYSQAYQREVRLGESRHEHLHFVGAYPMRLRGEELWDALTVAVGPFAEKTPLPGGLREVLGRIRDPDFYTVFKRLFDYDPNAGANEVEPSVAQSLMLLNNAAINTQISATGDTSLARIVEQYSEDDDAIRQIYLQVLSRQPTSGELTSCREYVAQVGNRIESMEDIFWTLMNSAEFRIKN